MSVQVFDKLLELRAISDGAITATGSTTGISLDVRMLPVCDWVIYVSALDFTTTDETYVFTLQASDLVGGTYTTIATHTWPGARGAGRVHIPINADMFTIADADCDWVRVTATLAGTTPSLTYGSFLAKAANKRGIAAKPGDLVTVP